MKLVDRYRYLLVALLIVVVAVTLLAGPSVGLRGEDLRYVASGEGTLGILIAWLLRGPGRGQPAIEGVQPSGESEEP